MITLVSYLSSNLSILTYLLLILKTHNGFLFGFKDPIFSYLLFIQLSNSNAYKMSSGKVIQLIQNDISGLGSNKSRNLVLKVRNQNGCSLTGLTMREILEKIKILLKNEADDKGEDEWNTSEESEIIKHKCKIII